MKERPEVDSGAGPADVRRAERRLAARSRELDALQSLGRRAAAAGSPEELFDSVIAALHRTDELDLALVGFEWDGEPQLRLRGSRPFSDAYVEQVVKRAHRFLGWTENAAHELQRKELNGFDAARGEREAFREEDVVLLPILRGGRQVACLLVVTTDDHNEQRLRLLYSASNQLSLHLDRLLRAREVETDRFRAIVDAMPQGVLLTDRRLRILQANRSAEQMLAACGLAGAASLASAVERLELAPLVERVRERGEAFAEGEAEPGDDRIWSVSLSRLPGEQAGAGGLVFVLSDVTDSRRLQRQLAQSEKMSSLGQMISGVAHELNNPLASIIGYAQLLRKTPVSDEKLEKRLEVLGREADRCRKIVANLLSFARQREPEWKPLSLNQAIENVVSLLRYQLRVDGIRLERDLDYELPAIEGDVHQLEQVLVNLLTNAAHAIREVSDTGTITLRTRVEGDRVALEIHDTGPGIPEEARPKIFDPFFTTKRPGEGTGLGLSLVCGIVTAHRGTIEALPDTGAGAAFRIRLPAGLGAAREEAGTTTSPRASSCAGCVLVVDDDEAVARMIGDALVKDGHRVHCVRSGRDALDRIEKSRFDWVVCDVKMPDMNGEQLYEALRRARPELARRMLWTTGDTLGLEPEQLARRTGLELLLKPFDLDELCERVRRGLGASDA